MSRFEDYIKTIAPDNHIPSYAKRFEDVVEVVRCKDCIYYHKGNWYDDDVCKVKSNNDRGYCAWGESKGETKAESKEREENG